ncbi:hypothetical protein L1887_62292 [Cichorium endivia]|nr:hypothetical protein L1887_62292 [Cichorium endivia]
MRLLERRMGSRWIISMAARGCGWKRMSSCSKRGPFMAFCLGFCDSDQVVGKLGDCSAGMCSGVCGCATGRTGLGCGADGELDEVGALTGRTKKPLVLETNALVCMARRAACTVADVRRAAIMLGGGGDPVAAVEDEERRTRRYQRDGSGWWPPTAVAHIQQPGRRFGSVRRQNYVETRASVFLHPDG